jgi:hypothetical protein
VLSEIPKGVNTTDGYEVVCPHCSKTSVFRSRPTPTGSPGILRFSHFKEDQE